MEPMIVQAISYPHLAHRPWIDRNPLASGLAIVTPQYLPQRGQLRAR
ncbi:MAG TPA: hypothetical protein VF353_07785 [Candidatus Binatia bacterium]